MNKIFKRIVLALLLVSMSFSLTGCGEKNIHDATKQEYNSRIDENLRYIEQLKKCGAITEDTEKLLKQYFKPWDDFMNELEKMGKNTSRLDSMITHVYSGAEDALGTKGVYSPKKASTVVPWGAGGEMDKGLSADNLFKMQNIVVWKAKFINKSNGIDELTKAITQIQEKQSAGDSTGANTIIDNYFENTSESLFPDKVPLLKETTSNGTGKNSFGKDFVVFGKTTNSEGGEVPKAAIDVRMLEINKQYVDLVTNSSSYTKSGGKYLIVNKRALLVAYPVSYIKSIKQDGDNFKPQFEKSNMLLNLADGSVTKYDNTKDSIETVYKAVNNSNKVYMTTVDDINILLGRATTDNSQTLKTITTEISELNNSSGEEGSDQAANTVKKKTLETVVSKATDNKGYKMDGSKLFSETNAASNSSFLMLPDTQEKYTYKESIKLPGEDKETTCEFSVECNKIILKDYLEFVATPGYEGYTGAGNYTPLGRRIRFTADVIMNGGKSTDTWAMYIDNSGSNMFPMGADTSKSTIPIRLEDIVGVDGNNEKIKVLRANANGEKVGKTSTEESLKKKVGNPGAEIEYVTEMEVAFPFPSSGYGGGCSDSEMVTNELQPFYGVKVNKDIYETSLFSSWLTTNSDTNGSQWWNNWLSANGYPFSLDLNELLNNKENELSYERERKNNIVLDMNVIENIQKDIDKENGMGLLAMVRTIFTVLGIILIFYGLLLPCSWLFDTNVLMGPKFTTILTFGKWVAVKDKDESMVNTGDGPSYVDMKDIIIGGILVMAIGILCVSFDVVKLIVALVKSTASVVTWVWNLIFR